MISTEKLDLGPRIAAAIRNLRTKLGWSQLRLARELSRALNYDVGERNVQRWESGDIIPSGDIVTVIQSFGDDETRSRFWELPPQQPPQKHVDNTASADNTAATRQRKADRRIRRGPKITKPRIG